MAGLTAVLTTGALAAWGWWHTPAGMLGWDGQHWLWTPRQGDRSSHEPGVVTVALDLQQHMLLVLHMPTGPSLWLTVEQGAWPARWHDLRRAVYSRASTAAPMAPPSGPAPAPQPSFHDRHP